MAEKKKQREIELATKKKQHEERLKTELRSQIILKCQKEKKLLEMKTIEDKFGKELEIQVWEEMGLPTQKLASPHVPEPQPWPIPGMSANPGYVTPTSILQMKKEKFDCYNYSEPSTPTGHGEKRKGTEYVTSPPSIKFATKQDFQATFTPSKSRGKSSHLQLFSPPGKSAS